MDVENIVALYSDFLSKLDFSVKFDIPEVELSDDLSAEKPGE